MNSSNAAWGGGYVTDLSYLPGYYRHQSPLHLHIACLLGGVAGLDLGSGEPLTHIELGCGHGFGAVALRRLQSIMASDGHRLQSGSHSGRTGARRSGGCHQRQIYRGRSG